MKRYLALILAFCLVFALSAPAYAAVGAGTQTDFDPDSNTGETTINVDVDASNISVSVPINMTVLANPNGGALAGVPEASAYKFVNKSYFPLYVVSAQATTVDGNWTLSDTVLTAADSPETGDVGKLQMTLTAGTTWTVSETAGLDTAATNWTLAAATTAAGTDTGITVAGSTSHLTTANNATSVVVITYTVSATPTA